MGEWTVCVLTFCSVLAYCYWQACCVRWHFLSIHTSVPACDDKLNPSLADTVCVCIFPSGLAYHRSQAHCVCWISFQGQYSGRVHCILSDFKHWTTLAPCPAGGRLNCLCMSGCGRSSDKCVCAGGGGGGACVQVCVCVCVCVCTCISCCYWTLTRLCLKSRILYYKIECYL